MSSLVERVKALQLPLDHLIVIGGGILDAYGIREAHDIDLLVSDELYELLKQEGTVEEVEKHGEMMLFNSELDIWKTWTGHSFNELAKTALSFDGVYFAHPDTTLAFKRARGTEKDLRDVTLLEEYLHDRN